MWETIGQKANYFNKQTVIKKLKLKRKRNLPTKSHLRNTLTKKRKKTKCDMCTSLGSWFKQIIVLKIWDINFEHRLHSSLH